MPGSIFGYFPSLSVIQQERISRLRSVYDKWNSRINVISRKDMDNFYLHHVLHSLSIAKVINFLPGTLILDAGTGGGFPGIPLAILFPDSLFTLLDSIGKKIKVTTAVAFELELENVRLLNKRVENEEGKYDFVVSRAVMEFQKLVSVTSKNITKSGTNSLENGLLCLKGGDLDQELGLFRNRVKTWEISDFFSETFFTGKKVVYLPSRFL
jgi:16S rRNA (guanine527-N7)-methyltransferase